MRFFFFFFRKDCLVCLEFYFCHLSFCQSVSIPNFTSAYIFLLLQGSSPVLNSSPPFFPLASSFPCHILTSFDPSPFYIHFSCFCGDAPWPRCLFWQCNARWAAGQKRRNLIAVFGLTKQGYKLLLHLSFLHFVVCFSIFSKSILLWKLAILHLYLHYLSIPSFQFIPSPHFHSFSEQISSPKYVHLLNSECHLLDAFQKLPSFWNAFEWTW